MVKKSSVKLTKGSSSKPQKLLDADDNTTLECVPLLFSLGLNCVLNNSAICVNVFKPVYGPLNLSFTRHHGNNPEFPTVFPSLKDSPTVDLISYQWVGPDSLPLELMCYLNKFQENFDSQEHYCFRAALSCFYESYFKSFPNQVQYFQDRGLDTTLLEEINPLYKLPRTKKKTGSFPMHSLETFPSKDRLHLCFKDGIPQKAPTSVRKGCICKPSSFLCTLNFFYFQTQIVAAYCDHGVDLTLARTIPTTSIPDQVVYKPMDHIPEWFHYNLIKPLVTDYEWLLLNTNIGKAVSYLEEIDHVVYLNAAGITMNNPFELLFILKQRQILQDALLATIYFILDVQPTHSPSLLAAPIIHIDHYINLNTVEEKLFAFFERQRLFIHSDSNNSKKYSWDVGLFLSAVVSLDKETRSKFLEVLPAIHQMMQNGHQPKKPSPFSPNSSFRSKQVQFGSESTKNSHVNCNQDTTNPLTASTPTISEKITNETITPEQVTNEIISPEKVTNKTIIPEKIPDIVSIYGCGGLSSSLIFLKLDEIEQDKPHAGKLFHIQSLNQHLSTTFTNQWAEIIEWNCTQDNAWVTYLGKQILSGPGILAAIHSLYEK